MVKIGTLIDTMKIQAGTTAGAVVLLTRLSRSVYRLVDEDQLGMKLKEFVMLNYLGDADGTTQGQLGEAMGIDANTVVLLLNGLEQRGFVVRERDPQDRRRHIVRITPAGRKALVRAERALESLTDEALGNLDADERTALRALLAKALGDGALAASAETA
jgi:DNA-binding MarR family transcriptional regulator